MRSIIPILIGFVGLGVARADAPPAGLRCLQRVYGGEAKQEAGRWTLVLPSGALPWDDGKVKTLDQAIDAPDLQDQFSIRYPTGPIAPITDPSHDPGRIRVEAIFEHAYPKSEIVKTDFAHKRVQFARRASKALSRVDERLHKLAADDRSLQPFLDAIGGTFNERVIAGTTRKSAHSFAVAIDLNPKLSHYWRWAPGGPQGKPKWQNKIPQAIVDAFEAEGFVWGGRWYHFDTMHFEYRPELLDPTCYESAK